LPALHLETKYVVDEAEERIPLFGVNLVLRTDQAAFDYIKPYDSTFKFMRDSGLNFGRLHLQADIMDPAAIEAVLVSAAKYGVYCEFDIYAISGSSRPKVPDWNVLNPYLATLAKTLRSHSNAILEIYNEPDIGSDLSLYNQYWPGVPGAIKTVRDNGFTGIILVMGDLGFYPGLNRASQLDWAVNHASIFQQTNVAADFHTYADYTDQGGFPSDYSAMANLWDNAGYVLAVQQAGICLFMTECGSQGSADSNLRLKNQLAYANARNINWCVWVYYTTDFPLIDKPLSWNAVGNLVVSMRPSGAITPTPITPTPVPIIPTPTPTPTPVQPIPVPAPVQPVQVVYQPCMLRDVIKAPPNVLGWARGMRDNVFPARLSKGYYRASKLLINGKWY
jgi:hypothetical protein